MRHRELLDRATAGLAAYDIAAADEAMRTVVEMVRVEFIDDLRAARAATDERIDRDIGLL
jgi:hypothetical protein